MEAIFQLFEGVCPHCGGELVIRCVGGFQKFHDDHTFEEGEVVVWEGEPVDTLDDVGMVGFDCIGCQRSMEAYCGAYGDWVASI